jgi:hypothetical protein
MATSTEWREDEAKEGYSFMGNATRVLEKGSLSIATVHPSSGRLR